MPELIQLLRLPLNFCDKLPGNPVQMASPLDIEHINSQSLPIQLPQNVSCSQRNTLYHQLSMNQLLLRKMDNSLYRPKRIPLVIPVRHKSTLPLFTPCFHASTWRNSSAVMPNTSWLISSFLTLVGNNFILVLIVW